METEFGKLGDEVAGFDLGRTFVEMLGPKIPMDFSVLEHVVDGGQHRGC